MAGKPRGVHLTLAHRAALERLVRARTTPQGVAQRCQIVLALSRGLSVRDVALLLGVARRTVELWRNRFENEGPTGLIHERAGRGRKRVCR